MVACFKIIKIKMDSTLHFSITFETRQFLIIESKEVRKYQIKGYRNQSFIPRKPFEFR